MSEPIIIYNTCCTTYKASKYYNSTEWKSKVLPLAIRIEDEEIMNFFLNTGYYKRLPYELTPEGIYQGDYLVYDYQRNKQLKETGCAPEISGIMCKDLDTGKKYILKNVDFYQSMECNLLTTTNVDCYDIAAEISNAVGNDILSRTDPKYPHKEHFILEGSYPFVQARKFFKKGIYPLNITKDETMSSPIKGPYREVAPGVYNFMLLPYYQYDYLIRENKGKLYFSEIVELDEYRNRILLEDDEIYSIKEAAQKYQEISIKR